MHYHTVKFVNSIIMYVMTADYVRSVTSVKQKIITPTTLWRNKNYYILDQDFSEYIMEQGIQEHNELWGFLEDFIKEECE